MGKIKDGKLRGINDTVKKVINSFYIIANRYYNKYHFKDGCQYIVYRGTKRLVITDSLVQPIPFSTAIEKEGAENWTGEECCLWEISFPLHTKFVCLDNPNEGKEVILPAGVLKIDKKDIISIDGDEGSKNITYYKCRLLPTDSEEEMYELWKTYPK
jgi:hypothetical protein